MQLRTIRIAVVRPMAGGMNDRPRSPLAMTLTAFALLAGCGGSDGPPPNIPPVASFTATPASGPPPLAVTFDATGSSDSDGSIRSFEWTFGGGATGSGSTVEHTYEDSGAFEVRLTVTDDDGAQASAMQEVVVNTLPRARILADPVDGVAPVTVTFDASESTDSDGEIVSYEWQVSDGAPVAETTFEHRFEEPGIYPVRLTVTDDLGGVAEAVFELNARDDAGVPFTVPYVPDGAYADALRPCIYAGEDVLPDCTMQRLPFLGAEFEAPSVDDVMTRVLVSHRWMGDSLREMLERLPADVRLLARSVTAIVISSDIRPAYYWPGSGAIYLDPDYFWRTPEERAVMSMEPDFRSAFGSSMQLEIPWRLVRNNVPWGAAGQSAGESVRIEALLPFLAFLLYHELSHAADFMPISRAGPFDPNATAWQAISASYAHWASPRLAAAHPLGSSVMRELAAIFFHGETPTAEQESLLPDDVIDEFATDGAIDFYAYSSQFEDLADLHDAILMSYHHGYEKDIGIVGTEGETIREAIVAWGQRGRMTDANVIDRMRWVIDELYPGNAQELHGYLNERPAPLQMRRGETWAENLVLEGGADYSSVTPGSMRAEGAASGTAAQSPELFGCIRVDGGVKAALADLRRRRGLGASERP